MTDLKRKSLPDYRQAITRRFTLPCKRDDGLADEIKEGFLHLKSLAEREIGGGASQKTKAELQAALTLMQALTQPQQAERMKIYFTVGKYPDGKPGEVFIKADRSGSLASGALDACATMISIGLQYGIPLEVMLDKLRHSRFEPEGYTRDGEFPSASSPLDLLAQWLGTVFPSGS